MYHNMCSSKL